MLALYGAAFSMGALAQTVTRIAPRAHGAAPRAQSAALNADPASDLAEAPRRRAALRRPASVRRPASLRRPALPVRAEFAPLPDHRSNFPWNASLQLGAMQSAGKSGWEPSASLGYQLTSRQSLGLSFQHYQRFFAGSQLRLRTDILMLEHSYIWNSNFYTVHRLGASQDTLSSRSARGQLEGHVLQGAWDFSLGVWVNRSQVEPMVWSYVPAAIWTGEGFFYSASAQYFAVHSSRGFSHSGHVALTFALSPRWKLRGDFAGGDAYEGEGVVDRFWEYGAGLSWRHTSRLSWNVGATKRAGQVRREMREQVGASWNF